ncbi:MAG: CNP1-like family protein [Sulfuritalea sp.]|nr:CNP1-like family protein [Sulfuritalea sp.]
MKFSGLLVLSAVALSAAAQDRDVSRGGRPTQNAFNPNIEDPGPWKEQREVEPPAFPKAEDLREIYVSATAANKFLIDASTLAVGTDGVVRYVLVVKTSGGATNVSFEGINCRDLRWKHYATGRSDGTWTISRAVRNDWRPIETKALNAHHAALSHDLFCPTGRAIKTADEGRNALRLGRHPEVN